MIQLGLECIGFKLLIRFNKAIFCSIVIFSGDVKINLVPQSGQKEAELGIIERLQSLLRQVLNKLSILIPQLLQNTESSFIG